MHSINYQDIILKSKEKNLSQGMNQILVEITSQCNKNCDFCYNNFSSGGSYQEITIYDLRVIVHFAKANGIQNIVLSGGEPLLHSRFFEIVNILKDEDINVTVITNGMLLDEDMVAFLSFANCRIKCTLESMNDITRVLPFIEKKEYLKMTVINHIYHRQSTNGFREMIDYVQTNYKIVSDINFAFDMGRTCIDENVIQKMLEIAIWAIEKKITGNYSLIGHYISIPLENYFTFKSLRCFNCSICHQIKIDINGNVFPCPYFTQKANTIGNIYKSFELDETKKNGYIETLYTRIDENSSCSCCKWKLFCGGGCLTSMEITKERVTYDCLLNQSIYEYLNDKYKLYP